jgi:hypothetical protein
LPSARVVAPLQAMNLVLQGVNPLQQDGSLNVLGRGNSGGHRSGVDGLVKAAHSLRFEEVLGHADINRSVS